MKHVSDVDLYRFAAYAAVNVGRDAVAWNLARALESDLSGLGVTHCRGAARSLLKQVKPKGWTIKDLTGRILSIARKRLDRVQAGRVPHVQLWIRELRFQRYTDLIERYGPVRVRGAGTLTQKVRFARGAPTVNVRRENDWHGYSNSTRYPVVNYVVTYTIDSRSEIVAIDDQIYARNCFRGDRKMAKLVPARGVDARWEWGVWKDGRFEKRG